jgi:PAS domain S-box-containing protein
MGSKRKYTDPAAVYHLKTHIQSGKETQASIINYRKDGSPFINLVTVIPISWDTDEIAYFVGFQVDLVEQPNAILEKMRNGTYVVNYSLLPTNSGVLPAVPALAVEKPDIPEEYPLIEESMYVEPRTIQISYPRASGAATAAAAQSSMTIAPELLEVMGALGTGDELDDDAAKKRWNKMLLDHTGDFVHVLSLKGSFLYVSPSVTSMLEYEPSDLVGKTLQSVCHPSDIVPVMRELKDSANATQPVINLLYRFRRKHSGYVWMEAQGKLYLEQSKSRKCVILVGRERPVYQLSWQDLRAAGGLGEKEYWSKITVNGMFLYNTPSVKTVIGHDSHNLQGKSMFDYIDASKAPELAIALNDAAAGKSVRMRYKLKNARGSWVDVITNFFPNTAPSNLDGKGGRSSTHPSIVLQTNEYASEMRRRATMGSASTSLPPPTGVKSSSGGDGQRGPSLLQSSSYRDMIVTTPDASDDGRSSASGSGSGSGSDSSAPSTFSAIPSTYKTLLSQAKAQSDNLFDELDTTRTTSWQYELHQLKLTNKKLKEEIAMLEAARRKRKKKDLAGNNESSTSAASSRVLPNVNTANLKTCANCGKTDSPEWRVGPSGARNLCNACGLRWAKATRNQWQSSSTPSASASSSGNSDMDAAASYLQPVGPFALQRPTFQHAESSRFNQNGP